MYFSTTISVLGLAALLTTAVSIPVEPRALDMKVKWYSHTTCSGLGGPARSYSRDVCMPLGDTDHGVKIVDRTGECRMYSYTSGDCSGKPAKTFTKLDSCNSLQKQWSVKIAC